MTGEPDPVFSRVSSLRGSRAGSGAGTAATPPGCDAADVRTSPNAPTSRNRPAADPFDRRSRPRLLRGPGALLTWLLAFTPLWWALGLGALIFPLLAVPMAVSLARRSRIEVPPGFAVWLGFCLVVVASLITLDLNPPGTYGGEWSERLLGAGYRLSGYVAVTIIALYAVNLTEREFPRRRLVGLLGWLGIVTVAGGLLGTFAGTAEFTSPVEALLPETVTADGFVQSLVHPQSAQIMDFLGYETPRPAAPWGYTNTWGNMLAICIPWLVVAVWCLPAGGRTRDAGPTRARWIRFGATGICALALIPVVSSMNRGLWLNLAVAGCLVAGKLLLTGNRWPVVALTAAAIVAAVAVLVTPLGEIVTARVANGHSDNGRAFATASAVEAVRHSPILGFGSTRKAAGSGDSIVVGPTADCPRCGGRTLGGNGQLWQVVFAHGIAGVVTYVGFFLVVLWRFRRDHSAIGIVGSVVMVMSLTSMFYYNALLAPLVVTMLCYALLWRNERDGAAEGIAR